MTAGKPRLSDRGWATIRKVALVLAVLLFLGGLVWSLYVFPFDLYKLKLFPALAVILVGVPITILLNAWEFLLSVHYNSRRADLGFAIKVSVISTAANMLPLPGGTIARVSALSSLGVKVSKGITVNLLIAMLWVGLALVYSGAWMFAHADDLYAASFVAAGAIVTVPAFFFLGRNSGSWSLAFKLVATKTALLVVDSARLLLCFLSLGISADFAQSSALSLSGVVGSAVSVVPAGLGVREATASALSSLVGLSLSAGFLVTALNRMLGLVTVLPIATVLSRREMNQPSKTANTRNREGS